MLASVGLCMIVMIAVTNCIMHAAHWKHFEVDMTTLVNGPLRSFGKEILCAAWVHRHDSQVYCYDAADGTCINILDNLDYAELPSALTGWRCRTTYATTCSDGKGGTLKLFERITTTYWGCANEAKCRKTGLLSYRPAGQATLECCSSPYSMTTAGCISIQNSLRNHCTQLTKCLRLDGNIFLAENSDHLTKLKAELAGQVKYYYVDLHFIPETQKYMWGGNNRSQPLDEHWHSGRPSNSRKSCVAFLPQSGEYGLYDASCTWVISVVCLAPLPRCT